MPLKVANRRSRLCTTGLITMTPSELTYGEPRQVINYLETQESEPDARELRAAMVNALLRIKDLERQVEHLKYQNTPLK